MLKFMNKFVVFKNMEGVRKDSIRMLMPNQSRERITMGFMPLI